MIRLPLSAMALLAALATGAVLSSCAALPVEPPKVDEDAVYKMDMLINVNGVEREGALVVPRAEIYHVDVQAKGTLDLFTMSTCHREMVKEDAGESKWFGNKRRVQLDYRPVPGLESTGECPVSLAGYEMNGGRHSWAMIEFEDPAYVLPAQVTCNGQYYASPGVTICQAKEGLIQRIEFKNWVAVVPPPGCPLPIPKDHKTFVFPIPPKQCVFAFKDIDSGKIHKLTTIGYSKVLVRKR